MDALLTLRSAVPHPGPRVLAPALPVRAPQMLVDLSGFSLPEMELSQAPVQARHAVLQLCTNLLRLQ